MNELSGKAVASGLAPGAFGHPQKEIVAYVSRGEPDRKSVKWQKFW